MKRSAMPQRSNPMARTGITKRSKLVPVVHGVAVRTRPEWCERLDDLARGILMITAGMIVRMPTNASETRWGWYGRCEWCMSERWLYAAHIWPKGVYRSMRWDEDNLFALCYHCHIQRWHNEPNAAVAFTEQKLGAEAARRLEQRAHLVKGAKVGDYALREIVLVRRLRELAPSGVPGIPLG